MSSSYCKNKEIGTRCEDVSERQKKIEYKRLYVKQEEWNE